MHWLFDNNISFKKRALQLFKKQSIECEIYREYIQFLGVKTENIKEIEDIPFLPISFFKSHQVKTKSKKRIKTRRKKARPDVHNSDVFGIYVKPTVSDMRK